MPQACSFDVLGVRLAAQRWHAGASHRVIALHGWLDNAESFSLLAPQLPDVDLVALDLAGHGWSEHRAAHASYLIWDDLKEICAVADALGWDRFAVLGHSRGAAVGALLAAACPERVTGLALIDGLWAMTCAAAEMPAQLQRALTASVASSRERHYATLEDMIAVRCRGALPMRHDAASRVVARNARSTPAGWQWRTDRRLQQPSLVMLTPEQQQAIHQSIVCPVRLVLAADGLGRSSNDWADALTGLSQINASVEAGGHHLHMEGAERILGKIFTHFFESL